MGSLTDRLKNGESEEYWNPLAGEVVEGRILSIAERVDNFGSVYPLLKIEKEDGSKLFVRAGAAHLKNALLDHEVKEGDDIAILYVGKERNDRGWEVHQYKVAVERGF